MCFPYKEYPVIFARHQLAMGLAMSQGLVKCDSMYLTTV